MLLTLNKLKFTVHCIYTVHCRQPREFGLSYKLLSLLRQSHSGAQTDMGLLDSILKGLDKHVAGKTLLYGRQACEQLPVPGHSRACGYTAKNIPNSSRSKTYSGQNTHQFLLLGVLLLLLLFLLGEGMELLLGMKQGPCTC